MTAEEKLKELYEVPPRKINLKSVGCGTMTLTKPRGIRIHPEDMDLIANLVIERFSRRYDELEEK